MAEQGSAARSLLFVLVVLVVVAFSTQMRLAQFERWQSDPEHHFFDDTPALTTLDAYYWLRMADEFRRGDYDTSRPDRLRAFPDGTQRVRPLPLPALLTVIAAVPFGGNLHITAIYLVPLLASLFIVPLACYFRRLGLGAAGLLAGLVGTFGVEYFPRTSIGRLDTDALNLFFPLLASLAILAAGDGRSSRRVYLAAGATGLCLLLFHGWYHHPGFTWVYLFALVGHLALQRVSRRTILGAAGLYLLCANPWYAWQGLAGLATFVSRYLAGAGSRSLADGVRLPDALATSTEAQAAPGIEALSLTVDQPLIAAVGLVLFGVLAARHWRRLVPLCPLLVLGLLAFVAGRRFAMFLAPFVGAGYGMLIVWGLKRLPQRVGALTRDGLAYAATGALFALLAGSTALGFVPRPSPSSSTLALYRGLAGTMPPGTPVVTWWDHGYALAQVGNLATYHDGATQGLATFLIARGLVSSRPASLYSTVATLNAEGTEALAGRLTDPAGLDEALRAIENDPRSAGDPVLLLFEREMILKYAAIHSWGSWDLRTGESTVDGYQTLSCRSMDSRQIDCGEMTVDLATGRIRDDLSLQEMLLIRDGRVERTIPYANPTGIRLLVLQGDQGAYGFLLVGPEVFASNFNQMFLLGLFDPTRFELIDDRFPEARVYRFIPR